MLTDIKTNSCSELDVVGCFFLEYHPKRIVNNIQILPCVINARHYTPLLSQFCRILSRKCVTLCSKQLQPYTNIQNISLLLLVVAGFPMKTSSYTAQESSSLLSIQMRLFIFGYFMHWLSTALSYKGCIINLIVCISCSFISNVLCPFFTLQGTSRQIGISPL